jgi:hypothetical protein
MEQLEIGERLLLVEHVERPHRLRELAFRRIDPGIEQARRQLADRGERRLREVFARCLVVLFAECLEAEHDAGHSVLRVELRHLLGKRFRTRHVAGPEVEHEGPLDQHRIAGIDLEGPLEIKRGDGIVALLAGKPTGQIAARQRSLRDPLIGPALGGEARCRRQDGQGKADR